MSWTLREELAALEAAGLRRRSRALSVSGVAARSADRSLRVFCSNDYLGLADDPRLVEAFTAAARRDGVGSGAAHLVTGHRGEHEALEAELAEFLGRERVLLFSTGYMANLGVIDALLGAGDAAFEDRLNHASLLDGARLAGARLQRYRHADPVHLEARLAGGDYRRRLVISDGVFSMDGDLAPLPALAAAAARHDAWLMVDDAHGIGVLGAGGGGIVQQLGLSPAQVPVLVGTLGKALGCFGAFVAGSAELVDYLVQKARTYVYTTAPPPAVAAAARAALGIIRDEPGRRQRLQALVSRFRAGAAQLGLPLMDSPTPIQPLLVGDARRAVALSGTLEQAGFLVTAIRPPTVPAGTARLRVTLSAAHREGDVDELLDVLGRLLGPSP